MFRESLLETSAGSIAQRGWATLMSFGLETIGVGVLLVTPMVVTQTIQMTDYSLLITAPLAAPPRGLPASGDRRPTTGGGPDVGGYVEPRYIPRGVPKGDDNIRRGGGDLPVCEGCVLGGIPGNGVQGGLPWMDSRPTVTNVPPPPQTEKKKIILSHLDEGMLLSKIEPRYPPLAKTTRTQGEVVMAAIIGRDGRIEGLRVLRGHPMLVQAAIDAVSQWRYRPYMLNGQAVEVDTTISVNFTLRQE